MNKKSIMKPMYCQNCNNSIEVRGEGFIVLCDCNNFMVELNFDKRLLKRKRIFPKPKK